MVNPDVDSSFNPEFILKLSEPLGAGDESLDVLLDVFLEPDFETVLELLALGLAIVLGSSPAFFCLLLFAGCGNSGSVCRNVLGTFNDTHCFLGCPIFQFSNFKFQTSNFLS